MFSTYSLVIILMLGIAALGYCVRHLRALNELAAKKLADADFELKQLSKIVQNQKADLDGDVHTIEALTWERDANAFMLETLMNDRMLAADYKIALPQDHLRKRRVNAYLNEINESEDSINLLVPISLDGPVPEQRKPVGNGSAYYKETA